jgi:hypothetical protein
MLNFLQILIFFSKEQFFCEVSIESFQVHVLFIKTKKYEN